MRLSTGNPGERSGEIRGFSFPHPLPRATTALSFVISTGAYPDFLLRAASDVRVCGSPQREPHADHQSHGSPREIPGERSGQISVWMLLPGNVVLAVSCSGILPGPHKAFASVFQTSRAPKIVSLPSYGW